MDLLLAPEFRPFAVAGVILVGLVVIEAATLLVGASLSHLLGKPVGFETDSGLAGLLVWLNVGRVPLLILIMLALGAFAMCGFALQTVAYAVFGPLPPLLAAVLAGFGALPIVRSGSRTVAHLVPQDETYAVEDASLVGRVAEVTIGPLDDGLPGRVKLKDQHGNWHFLRTRAATGHGPMAVGSHVLLVEQDGGTFLAIPAGEDFFSGP